MKEKIERNKELWEKKIKGETYRRLSIEYNLSIPTLQRIMLREKQKNLTI